MSRRYCRTCNIGGQIIISLTPGKSGLLVRNALTCPPCMSLYLILSALSIDLSLWLNLYYPCLSVISLARCDAPKIVVNVEI